MNFLLTRFTVKIDHELIEGIKESFKRLSLKCHKDFMQCIPYHNEFYYVIGHTKAAVDKPVMTSDAQDALICLTTAEFFDMSKCRFFIAETLAEPKDFKIIYEWDTRFNLYQHLTGMLSTITRQHMFQARKGKK